MPAPRCAAYYGHCGAAKNKIRRQIFSVNYPRNRAIASLIATQPGFSSSAFCAASVLFLALTATVWPSEPSRFARFAFWFGFSLVVPQGKLVATNDWHFAFGHLGKPGELGQQLSSRH
jgi:hypothetical protein